MQNHITHTPTCIYCGVQSTALTEEHIIPEGLGGDQVLENASCHACNDITSRIELRVLRQSYGLREVRSVLEIGRRRRQEKPRSTTLVVRTNSVESEIEVPLDSHPLILSLPLFSPPTMLTGRTDPTGIRLRGVHNYSLGPDPRIILSQLGVDAIRSRRRHYDNDFGKLLAKVAWSSWVAECGLSYLEDAWLPQVITGSESAVGRYVGSLDYALAGHPNDGYLHSVHLEIMKLDGYWLSTVRIQLFLQITPSPTYIVCVGRIRDAVANRLQTDGWMLPQKGAIGKPLRESLPRYISTTILGDEERAKQTRIYHELHSIGLC